MVLHNSFVYSFKMSLSNDQRVDIVNIIQMEGKPHIFKKLKTCESAKHRLQYLDNTLSKSAAQINFCTDQVGYILKEGILVRILES